ncbi:Peptidoglycan-associated lipoprotein [Ralstonia sp. LMG 32965]|uniref:OmpA family protein n=1 Tax=Ralstonia flatus TaxID=3058601 RepID=UPI0028F5FD84|nr:OmpA family protein [Ralstonia sp. LMG 32965]CAJ0902823.1 Peptidoglycan-associated lipoprotein [Ralstonia sp. LMG 32965]
MTKQPHLNGVARALLRALDRGEARGIRELSERAAGRPLRASADLDELGRYVAAIRDLIERGYLDAAPDGSAVRLSLSPEGKRAIRPSLPYLPSRAAWTVLGASLFAAGLTGCTPMPVAQPRPLLMGAPVLTGLAQVRDPQTGTDYFVPCNPCAAPTPKTAVMVGDAGESRPPRVPAVESRATLAKLDAHTVATLAMPADEPAIPAGSAKVATEAPPVTVLAASKPDTGAAAATTPAEGIRSLPFPLAASVLGEEAKRGLAELLPLALKAERVYIRGRTDSTGTAQGNRALAIARAAVVRAAFVGGGVDPRKLKVSYCTTCFVAPNDTETGRSANRRVEVELVMPGARN